MIKHLQSCENRVHKEPGYEWKAAGCCVRQEGQRGPNHVEDGEKRGMFKQWSDVGVEAPFSSRLTNFEAGFGHPRAKFISKCGSWSQPAGAVTFIGYVSSQTRLCKGPVAVQIPRILIGSAEAGPQKYRELAAQHMHSSSSYGHIFQFFDDRDVVLRRSTQPVNLVFRKAQHARTLRPRCHVGRIYLVGAASTWRGSATAEG